MIKRAQLGHPNFALSVHSNVQATFYSEFLDFLLMAADSEKRGSPALASLNPVNDVTCARHPRFSV